jgi:hypothetical protein
MKWSQMDEMGRAAFVMAGVTAVLVVMAILP